MNWYVAELVNGGERIRSMTVRFAAIDDNNAEGWAEGFAQFVNEKQGSTLEVDSVYET